MEASLQVLRSLRKVHRKLWTFPAPTILVGERDVWLGSLKQLDRLLKKVIKRVRLVV